MVDTTSALEKIYPPDLANFEQKGGEDCMIFVWEKKVPVEMAWSGKRWKVDKSQSAGVLAVKQPIREIQTLFWNAIKGGK